MSSQKFKSVNDEFLIRNSISDELLDKCFTFVINQRCIERTKVEEAYKKNISLSIEFPQNIKDEGVDVVIKSKFNNNDKFVNLNKSVIFYEYKNSGLRIEKVKKLQLGNIKFFPQTHVSGDLIFQQLAKGIYFRPEKLSELSQNLTNNIAETINILSKLEKNKIKVSNYLDNLKFTETQDSLNFQILNTFILIIKNHKDEEINISLTHGDFKFEHLFTKDNQLEYLIDWENVGLRVIFFDLMNFFIPWFVHRSFNYIQIKDYINQFVKNYLSHLEDCIKEKYDLYFSVFALERYIRINDKKNLEFDKNKAYQRYNILFKSLANELK
jgi:thiamine kinase-like enzyme